MKKLFLVLWLSMGLCCFAKPMKIMELPPFERAVLIIKHYETLHQPKHWPYIGYGHLVLPGESYKKGYQLSEKEADLLLRKDLKKFLSYYKSYGEDSLILAVLAYNCGPGKVNESSVLQKLQTGNRNIFKDYLSYCHYKGRFHSGLYRRRYVEYKILFEKK